VRDAPFINLWHEYPPLHVLTLFVLTRYFVHPMLLSDTGWRVVDGPFTEMKAYTYPGGNPAPIFHNGAFYMTNQGTSEVRCAPAVVCWPRLVVVSRMCIPSLEGWWVMRGELKRTNW
jgi:hypothetical protein